MTLLECLENFLSFDFFYKCEFKIKSEEFFVFLIFVPGNFQSNITSMVLRTACQRNARYMLVYLDVLTAQEVYKQGKLYAILKKSVLQIFQLSSPVQSSLIHKSLWNYGVMQ